MIDDGRITRRCSEEELLAATTAELFVWGGKKTAEERLKAVVLKVGFENLFIYLFLSCCSLVAGVEMTTHHYHSGYIYF